VSLHDSFLVLRLRNSEFRVSNFVLPLLSGLLLVACFPKLHVPGLVWIACLPLLASLAREKSLKRAFLLGYVCGAVFLAGSCYWFIGVTEIYGRLSPGEAWSALFAFLVVFSAFFGSFGWLVGWSARRSPAWALALSPFLWIGMELARTYLITGFPWNLLGYAVQAPGLRQIASATGVYGLSFLAVATSAVLAWPFFAAKRGRASAAAAVWAVLLLLAQWKLAPPPVSAGTHTAYLVQPNVPLDEAAERWAPWRDPQPLNSLITFTESAACGAVSTPPAAGPGCAAGLTPSDPHPLLIWAENSAPLFFARDPVFTGAMVRMVRETGAYAVFNTITFAGTGNSLPQNSAIVLGPDGGVLLQYAKIHLVPFGEYVPAWAFPGVIGKIVSEVGDFVPGTHYSTAATPAGHIAVLICYEAIFPGLVRRLAASPGVLVNISNDAWYGDSAAAYQHLEMARLRAIENHRYLLRATNDGVTTVIDPYGRLIERLPRYQQGVLPAHFDFDNRRTFYTAHGDVFAWACAAVGAVLLLLGRRGLGARQ